MRRGRLRTKPAHLSLKQGIGGLTPVPTGIKAVLARIKAVTPRLISVPLRL